MAELAIDRLGAPLQEDGSRAKSLRRRPITSILERVQCFANYTSVMAQSHPIRISDMMGYLYLILDAHMEFEGEGYIGYDHRFRQATTPGEPWARIDSTFWNMAFPCARRCTRCIYCFGINHSSADCSHTPDRSSTDKSIESSHPAETLRPRHQKVCKEWNFTMGILCSYPRYKFEHICWYRSRDPTVLDVYHKAIHCPQRPESRPLGKSPQNMY